MPSSNEKEIDLQNGGRGAIVFRRGRKRRSVRMLSLDLSEIRLEGDISAFMAGEGENDDDAAGEGGVRFKAEEDDVNSGDDDFSVYNRTDDDEDSQSLIRCPFCDFELDIAATRRRLEEAFFFQPMNMVCSVCEEKVGEDALQKLMSQKPTSKSEKSSVCSNDLPVLDDNILAGWGISDISAPNPSVSYTSESFTNNGSDISDAISSGDEEDQEESKLRASFVQQLVLSTF